MTVGIDEVGRGCWAGPVVAGAVILGDALPVVGLKDSKKLSARQRSALDIQIRAQAKAWGIGWVTAVELDAIGLTAAVRLAMLRAIADIDVPYDDVIIDGSYNFLPEYPNVQTLVKADDTVPAVSAASIIAKVARDTYMAQMATTYPAYGFESHVGYGTARHRAALAASGICPLHRKSFGPIRALL
jgi:ribonuclease HII